MERKLKVFIAMTIVLTIIVVMLAVTEIYLLKNPTLVYQIPEKTSNVESSNTNASQYKYNLSKRKVHQAVREDYIEIFVDTEGNAYLYTMGNIDNIEDTQIKSNLKNVEKRFSTYSPKDYEFYEDTSIEAYKLDLSKVLTVYNVGMGNGGFRYFVFVKENGEISYLNYDNIIYNGQISVKNVSNLKNVVSIVDNTYTMTPYAITLDGNEVSLYDYIK